MSLDANNWATGPFSSARMNASWAQRNVNRLATHVVTNSDRAILLPSGNDYKKSEIQMFHDNVAYSDLATAMHSYRRTEKMSKDMAYLAVETSSNTTEGRECSFSNRCSNGMGWRGKCSRRNMASGGSCKNLGINEMIEGCSGS
ncbi:hypothetical protein M440DRAFT_1404832 [Trichoderma longibrachiatum ATCC 18648]|uniref:Uncharacterized protein n=1 Tax=Trichoderma longibrachiatum ATCC 18648 TaxID=983965 RepID=A0A2T4BUV5_TRILO|nr:hypothetical protein M440DRAFT_1404832 [Trichoderma longibrachiatum ATCC 18648]